MPSSPGAQNHELILEVTFLGLAVDGYARLNLLAIAVAAPVNRGPTATTSALAAGRSDIAGPSEPLPAQAPAGTVLRADSLAPCRLLRVEPHDDRQVR